MRAELSGDRKGPWQKEGLGCRRWGGRERAVQLAWWDLNDSLMKAGEGRGN